MPGAPDRVLAAFAVANTGAAISAFAFSVAYVLANTHASEPAVASAVNAHNSNSVLRGCFLSASISAIISLGFEFTC
jgi:hypothetical protein